MFGNDWLHNYFPRFVQSGHLCVRQKRLKHKEQIKKNKKTAKPVKLAIEATQSRMENVSFNILDIKFNSILRI